MTLPTFIVIGAAKAGTTALYWYLAEHPQIFMSPLKETNYFAYGVDESGELLYGDPDHHKFPVRTLAAYEELFDGTDDEVAVGEASPIYIECPQAAGRIADALPDARIIVGIRNPVDRAYSDYQMYLRSRGRKLDPAVDLEPDAAWAQPDSHWMRIGRYHEMLVRFFEVFPATQIHAYVFEDMRAHSLDVVQSVYGFLGVDPGFHPDLETPHNVGGVPARMGVEKLLTNKRIRALVEPLIPDSAVNLARRLRTRNLQKAPRLPDDMRNLMTDAFRDDIGATQDLLRLDLGRWLETGRAGDG